MLLLSNLPYPSSSNRIRCLADTETRRTSTFLGPTVRTFLNKCSWIIIPTLPKLVHTLAAISCTAICQFYKISNSTRRMFTSVKAVSCTWACSRLASCSLSSENLLHQSYTHARDKVSSSYFALPLRRISAGYTFSFTRNLMIYRCCTLGVTGVTSSCTCNRDWEQCSHLPRRVFHCSGGDIFC
jgi:hypothetical protein